LLQLKAVAYSNCLQCQQQGPFLLDCPPGITTASFLPLCCPGDYNTQYEVYDGTLLQELNTSYTLQQIALYRLHGYIVCSWKDKAWS